MSNAKHTPGRRAAALIALALSVAACTPPTDGNGKRISYIGVDRVDDEERDVTCYVYRTYAISCLYRQTKAKGE